MSKGRPASPAAAKRGTTNRAKNPSAKVQQSAVVEAVAKGKKSTDVVLVESFPPPVHLPEPVHGVWRAAVADLGGANHMRESFTPTLVAYCQAVYVHTQASANIQEFGVLVEGPHGMIPNPLLKVQKEAAATMLRMAETLGLTPAARIRVGLMEVTGMSLLAGLNSVLDGK